MRAPLSWIREFTPLEAEPGEIAEALDRLGLEVESVDAPGREIIGVEVAKVLDVRAHPNADKLSLVDIDTGSTTTTVVCGAPNVVVGMVVPYAPAGATLPGGFRLERRKIRGEMSDGMLCSAKELGLGDDHSGILGLDDPAALGADVREVLGLDEVVFDLSITPNRPDAMCMIGVARDLAAHFGLPLRVPDPTDSTPDDGVPDAPVDVDDTDRCPRYLARVARVTTGPSPDWMVRRLMLAGMRSISNVVDVTNYVLLERGQPLHAFDRGRLGGGGIVVRLASDGEVITTLDGLERALDHEDLLICDRERVPQAIAGIMGGSTAEVADATAEILLESAYFAPMGISRSSKRLGLRSESSARFERGIDPNGVRAGADRAMRLLAEVAGADVAAGAVDVYPRPVEPERISVRTSRVNALLGTALDGAAARDALRPLGIEIETETDDFVAVAPTFRPDLTREIDIVEEVARRVGLDDIPRTLPHTTTQGGGLTPRQRERRLIADVMVGFGAAEASTLPFLAVHDLERVGLPTAATVEATNSLRAEEPILRPAILPGLLKVAATNAGYGLTDLSLFELGHVFAAPAAGRLLPDERDHLALVLVGAVRRAPVEPDRPVDVYDVVDALRMVRDALELDAVRLTNADRPGFTPGRVAAVEVDGIEIGSVGELAPTVLAGFGLTGPAVALEVDVDGLLGGRRRERAFRPVSHFPASLIDLAFECADTVAVAEILATLRAAAGDVLEDARCFDLYRSDAMSASGRKSLAFALRLRAPDRTLTDAEVAEVRAACIAAVTREHAAELRT